MKERLTRERVLEIIEKSGLHLTKGSYGRYDSYNKRKCGCAVTARVVDITDDVDRALQIADEARNNDNNYLDLNTRDIMAKIVGDNPDYMQGLDNGFEHGQSFRSEAPTEYYEGVEDGIMIRSIQQEMNPCQTTRGSLPKKPLPQ